MAYLVCEICGKEYYCRPSQVEESKYCSRKCQDISQRTGKDVECPTCGKVFYAQKSRLERSKSGLVFCSRECKDLATRLEGGIPEIHPPQYDSENNYRSRAFRNKESKCSICGYAKYEEVLRVHHIDGNRSNNKLDNLIILCPTCHVEVHLGFKKLATKV